MDATELSSTQLIDRLRNRGWRLSAQRRVIAEVLQGDHVHMSAEEIYEHARRKLDEISQATVYNTLRELVAMCEVRVVPAEDGVKRYDPNVTFTHHHLLCTCCQALRDVRPEGVECVTLPVQQRFGFTITGMDIVFKGLCPECQGTLQDGTE
jgi:Fur family ferric uptake transcriptional regulator